jgi:lysophospholipase L1-like esterase
MVKFTGSRTVGVTLSTVSSNAGGSQYFVASIDGGNLVRLNHPDAKSTLQLPFQLDPTKEYTLLFGRSDEASYGKTTLHDIALDQGYTALAQPPAHGLRYEVIGDSITAGFKVTGAPATSTEDVFKTYEYYLKEHWGIEDWSVIARSGIGVTDGWGQRPMHEQYVCSSFEFSGCPEQWDFFKWTADVVSINLGTNDFTFGTPTAAQFEKAYSDLVALVRAKYPQAVIFCIVPIIYSCFPSAPKWTTMRTAIENVVNKADSKVHFIPTGDASDPWLNCASEFSDYTHPTVEGHKKFAEKLQVLLDPLLPKTDVVIV